MVGEPDEGISRPSDPAIADDHLTNSRNSKNASRRTNCSKDITPTRPRPGRKCRERRSCRHAEAAVYRLVEERIGMSYEKMTACLDKAEAGARGEYRVQLAKDTVFRLRAMALVESARTGKHVSWLTLLQAAADTLVNGYTT